MKVHGEANPYIRQPRSDNAATLLINLTGNVTPNIGQRNGDQRLAAEKTEGLSQTERRRIQVCMNASERD